MEKKPTHRLPIPFDASVVFNKNYNAYWTGKRLVINQGGTSSGKTWSILQVLIVIAITSPIPFTISVMSESVPHLKMGAIKDFKRIMGDSLIQDQFNLTDQIYDFYPSPSQIEFFSADNPSKVHGPRRDILFVNEVINVPKTVYDAAAIRTANIIFTDYNPCEQFWLMDEIGKPGVEYIESTYLDAIRFLPKAIIEDIEKRQKTDPNWFHVYGLGKVGNVTGLVHPAFTQIDVMPEPTPGAIDFYGLDFGYTNDPSVLVHNIIIGDDLYSDQVFFQTGLMNNQIAKLMEQNGIRKSCDEIYADCAEPKSIDEIYQYGYNIKPCVKGPDSVLAGIQKVNQYRQHWTKRSVEAIKEQRNYRYIIDKNGKITNKPIEVWNHAMEARRQSVFTKLNEGGMPGICVA